MYLSSFITRPLSPSHTTESVPHQHKSDKVHLGRSNRHKPSPQIGKPQIGIFFSRPDLEGGVCEKIMLGLAISRLRRFELVMFFFSSVCGVWRSEPWVAALEREAKVGERFDMYDVWRTCIIAWIEIFLDGVECNVGMILDGKVGYLGCDFLLLRLALP